MLGNTAGRCDGSSEEGFGRRYVACGRQPTVEHLAIEVNAAIQVMPLAQDPHVGLVHQPRRDWRLPMPTNSLRQGWSELLDPAQDGSAADVDSMVGEHTGDAFGRGTQLELITV